MQEERLSEHHPPNSAPLSLCWSSWRLVWSTAFHLHLTYSRERLGSGKIRVTLLPEREDTGMGVSIPHPSLFAFLTAGSSKVPPSAPNHAGMLQKDLQITSLP